MIIGITGGIASGKSICTNYFVSVYGIPVIDADIIAKELVKPGNKAWQEIVNYFGQEILLPNKELNRPLMRKLVFSDNNNRLKLNEIIHPLIRLEISRLSKINKLSDTAYQILSAPLLFENHLEDKCSLIITVDTPVKIQITRGSQRDNCNPDYIKNIINVQISRTERIKLSNFIIDNSGTLKDTFTQIDDLHHRIEEIYLLQKN